MTTNQKYTYNEIIKFGIDNAELAENFEGKEAISRIYNTRKFLIDRNKAALFVNSIGPSKVKNEIDEYEISNYGKQNTDFNNSIGTANMYCYIKGEEALNKIEAIKKSWDIPLSELDIQTIKLELEKQFLF